jgi:hypothetical protein
MIHDPTPEQIQMRNACYSDILTVIDQAIADNPTADGRASLRILSDAISSQGVAGFGLDGKTAYVVKIHATNNSALRIFVRANLAADGTLELNLYTISSHPPVDANDIGAHDSAEIKIYQGGK